MILSFSFLSRSVTYKVIAHKAINDAYCPRHVHAVTRKRRRSYFCNSSLSTEAGRWGQTLFGFFTGPSDDFDGRANFVRGIGNQNDENRFLQCDINA